MDQPVPPATGAWPVSTAAPPGVGRRLAAHVLDGTIVALLTVAAVVPAVVLDERAGPAGATGPTAVVVGVLVSAGVASYLLLWPVADVVMTHRRGGTPGKLLLGLRVVDDRGGRPRWSTAALRVLVKHGLGLVYLAGPLTDLVVMVADPSRRSVHDRAASTAVVSTRAGGAR